MKYIIDTDPGVDDAIAIIMAYRNKLDIIGFTLVSGNIPAAKSENNLKVIQDFLGSNIRMYKGNYENEDENNVAYHVHGKDGLGYLVYPKNNRQFERKSAEDFIIKSSKKYRDDLTLICFGPLTNVANAIKKDKDLPKRIKHLVIMGASYAPDAKEKYHEFNFKVDPKSAKLVLEAGFEDIKIVTHEVGVECFAEKDYVLGLINSDDIVSRFISSASMKYIEFCHEYHNVIGLCCPDPATIASVIDPSIIKFSCCNINVPLDEEQKGVTDVSLTENSNIKISTGFNIEKFRDLFKKTFN